MDHASLPSSSTKNGDLLVRSGRSGHSNLLLHRGRVIAPVPEDGWVLGNQRWADHILADYLRRGRRRLSHRRVIRVLMRQAP